jgi:hypothetical protein
MVAGLAGFEVTLTGRIEASPEEKPPERRLRAKLPAPRFVQNTEMGKLSGIALSCVRRVVGPPDELRDRL